MAINADILLEKVGETDEGEKCTYTVMRMNHWEGQIAVFAAGPNGNFRIELNEESLPLRKGEIAALYNETEITYKKETMKGERQMVLTQVQKEYDNVFRADVETIKIAVDSDLMNPTRVEATEYLKSTFSTKLVESLNCNY
jgi:hypothetical protein